MRPIRSRCSPSATDWAMASMPARPHRATGAPSGAFNWPSAHCRRWSARSASSAEGVGRHDLLDHRSAVAASMFSAVSNIHEVRPQPIRRGSSTVDDRRHAHPDLGHAELRVVGGDADVAGGRHFVEACSPPPCRSPARQSRMAWAELVDHGEEATSILRMPHRRHAVDVGAADEGPAAAPENTTQRRSSSRATGRGRPR